VGTSGSIAGLRSALVRPLDRRYPTNLAVMILVPLAGAGVGAATYWSSRSPMEALEWAARVSLTTFGGWALAREIAPDDNPGAFVSMGLAVLTLLLFPSASILPLFTAVMLARIVNRSVGYPATWLDSLAVTLLAGWTAYSNHNPGPALVAAAGFGLDTLLPDPLRRQFIFALLCLAWALSILLFMDTPASPRETVWPLNVSIGIISLAYALAIMLITRVRSVADRTGKPLHLGRVRAAMAVAWLMGAQGALSGEVASPPSLLIWAVLGGLLLMLAFRPAIAGMIPLVIVGTLACAGSAPSTLPSAAPGDTLMDVGGHRLHFRVWPNRSRFTLVFEAGGGAALSSWESVPHDAAEQLRLRVIAYDRAGLGSSETGPFDLTPDQEIHALDEALERLGAGPIILVGHSYGGLLSFLHALRRPDRVAGLVLVDPMNPDFIRRVTLPWLNNTAPDIVNPSSSRDTVIVRMKRTIETLVAATEPAIASLEIPIVVLTAGVPWWRDSVIDQAWRASHETIAGARPNRRLLIATQSRHGIPETEPGRILDAVRLLQTLLAENE